MKPPRCGNATRIDYLAIGWIISFAPADRTRQLGLATFRKKTMGSASWRSVIPNPALALRRGTQGDSVIGIAVLLGRRQARISPN